MGVAHVRCRRYGYDLRSIVRPSVRERIKGGLPRGELGRSQLPEAAALMIDDSHEIHDSARFRAHACYT